MTSSPVQRSEVTDAKRIVVKVGSTSLSSTEGGVDSARLAALVNVLAGAHHRGLEVVLV